MDDTNAVRGFFQKYGAVPATNAGPQWEQATVEALAVHLRGLTMARRSHALTPANHKALGSILADLTAVAGEMWRRAARLAQEAAVSPADWPGRSECGKLLAELAASGDVLRMEAR